MAFITDSGLYFFRWDDFTHGISSFVFNPSLLNAKRLSQTESPIVGLDCPDMEAASWGSTASSSSRILLVDSYTLTAKTLSKPKADQREHTFCGMTSSVSFGFYSS